MTATVQVYPDLCARPHPRGGRQARGLGGAASRRMHQPVPVQGKWHAAGKSLPPQHLGGGKSRGSLTYHRIAIGLGVGPAETFRYDPNPQPSGIPGQLVCVYLRTESRPAVRTGNSD
jgi:hypothetical protein